jgi:hypothetical protein
MERDVLARLKRLADSGRIEPATFFRVRALMGVSFAAAMAVALSSPVFAKAVASASPRASTYADFVGPDVVAYIDAVGATNGLRAGDEPFDDHYFGESSGEPFHKFDKAPDFKPSS